MNEDIKLGAHDIMERIPHRYPFLMVDRVVECKPGESIRAIKNVTVDEPFFVGHFPGHNVMPGVLVVEALAQAAGVLTWESVEPDARDFIMYLVAIDKARFKRPVLPGDQLILNVVLLGTRRDIWRFEGKAEVDGELAVGAEIWLVPRRPS